MTSGREEPDRFPAGQFGRVMGELSRILAEARALAAREPDRGRRGALNRLIEELEGRVAPVSAEFARVCLRLLSSTSEPDLSGPDLSRLGLRFAAALRETDPRIHGAERALSALRAALMEGARAP